MVCTRSACARAAPAAAAAVTAIAHLVQHAHKFGLPHFWHLNRVARALHPVTRAAAAGLPAPPGRWAAVSEAADEPMALDDEGRALICRHKQLLRAAPLSARDPYALKAAASLRGLFLAGRRVACCCLGERLAAAGTAAPPEPGGQPHIALYELLPGGGALLLARTSADADLAMSPRPGLVADELQVTDVSLVDEARALVVCGNRWGVALLRQEGGDELVLSVDAITTYVDDGGWRRVGAGEFAVWDGRTPVRAETLADYGSHRFRPLRSGSDKATLEGEHLVYGVRPYDLYEGGAHPAHYETFLWNQLCTATSAAAEWSPDNTDMAYPFRAVAAEQGFLPPEEEWPAEEFLQVLATDTNLLDNTDDRGAGFYQLRAGGVGERNVSLVTHNGVSRVQRGALAATGDISWLRTVQADPQRFVALCGTRDGGLRLAAGDAQGNVVLRTERRLLGRPGKLQPPARWSPSGRFVACQLLHSEAACGSGSETPAAGDAAWVICDLSQLEGFASD